MAWYKTGTITATNGDSVITGVDTRFAANSRVGDGLNGPDGNWYEVVNIASETVISIYPVYQGSTIADSTTWMIAPLQGYNKESADRLRAITDQFKDLDVEVQDAKDAATAAKVSETNSKTSETNAKASETNSANSATSAGQSATDALGYRNAAQTAATNAVNSASAANTSETNAKTSETNAKTSETNTAVMLGNKQDKNVNLTAFSGLTGVADRIPYFTGEGALSIAVLTQKARSLLARSDSAGMRAEISAAGSGVNSDITQISGLTTALSVAQGGTGSKTAIDARAALGVDVTLASAVLDPQTAGGLMFVTTVNGFSVFKYANGQLCISGNVTSPLIAANTNGNFDVTIPSGLNGNFTASAYCSVAPSSSNNIGGTNSYIATLTSVRVYINNGPTAQTFTGSVTVWGRWK